MKEAHERYQNYSEEEKNRVKKGSRKASISFRRKEDKKCPHYCKHYKDLSEDEYKKVNI